MTAAPPIKPDPLRMSLADGFALLVDIAALERPVDRKALRAEAQTRIRELRHAWVDPDRRTALVALEQRWRASVEAGQPDETVYADDAYLAEAWACWANLSRRYLVNLVRPSMLPPHGAARDLGPVRRVVDLGCDAGLTTASLACLFPRASVVGVGRPATPAGRIAAELGTRAGFRVVATPTEAADLLGGPADLAFSAEYFTRVPRPAEAFSEVVSALRPRALVQSCSFTARAVGHYPAYDFDGAALGGSDAAAALTAEIMRRGYRRVPFGARDGRPAYWRSDRHNQQPGVST